MQPRFKDLRGFILGVVFVAGLLLARFSGTAQAEPPAVLKPAPAKATPFTNSLGMKFVPVPGTKVLFCVWKTRLRDFKRFVDGTGYDAGDYWKNPGFAQTGDHPVCGMSYDDASKFCDWLTGKALGLGLLKSGQRYRLPTDAEWSVAVGPTKYPWGEDYPPPSGAGNYNTSGTSPVGAFRANAFGLFDLGGNLWEWCDDYCKGNKEMGRVLRGASWLSRVSEALASSSQGSDGPGIRGTDRGFRCVVAWSSSP